MTVSRRWLAVGASAAVLATAACGTKSASSGTDASAQIGKTYTITWGGATPPGNPLTVQAETFRRLVEAGSKGRITVHEVDSSALGAPPSLVQQVKADSIQVTSLAPQYFAPYAKAMDVFSLPFLFPDLNTALKLMRGSAGQSVASELQSQSGMTVLAWGSLGFTELITKNQPVVTSAEMSGLKVRVLPSAIGTQVIQALGATPVTLDSTELLTALQSGTVVGDVDPLAQIVSYKDYTVAKYLSVLNLFYNPDLVVINTKFLDSLPPDLQQVVKNAALQATNQEVQVNNTATTQAMKVITGSGVKVINLTSAQLASFTSAEHPVYSSFASSHGQQLLDSFKSAG